MLQSPTLSAQEMPQVDTLLVLRETLVMRTSLSAGEDATIELGVGEVSAKPADSFVVSSGSFANDDFIEAPLCTLLH